MEFKPKNRDWVKNVSIIFLSVLLVLTFFSNTWMNRSLPEVATQYVTNGTITAKVRGSGTVSAVGVTSVKAEQTREIRAVMVKVGQEVKPGDVLFVLGQGEASELEAAQELLRQLQLSYQKTAVGIVYPSYAGDERRIQDAKEEMDAAKAALDMIAKGSGKTVNELVEKQTNVSEKLEEAMKVRDAERQAYDELITEAKDDLVLKANARDDAQRKLAKRGISFIGKDDKKEWVFEYTDKRRVYLKDDGTLDELQSTGMAATVYSVNPDEFDASLFGANEDQGPDLLMDTPETLAAIPEFTLFSTGDVGDNSTIDTSNENGANASNESDPAGSDPAGSDPAGSDPGGGDPAGDAPGGDAPGGGNPAGSDPGGGNPGDNEPKPSPPPQDDGRSDLELMQDFQRKQKLYEAVKFHLETIPRSNLDNAQAKVDSLQKEYDGIQDEIDAAAASGTSSAAYDKAKATYKAAREAYLSLVDALEEKKASDARTQSLSYLDLSDLNVQIENAKKKVQELSGGEENQVLAKSAGTIETIDCAPGDTKLKGDLLCTIEVPDLGYTMSFSVTNDQARRLRPGDSATVSNYYWGNQIVATLESIKADPKNPQTNKLLTFAVKGDVTAGTELTISVGQKSANYDIVVPNSSIRSDTNGSFVLAIESKNSPLGNRYIARRVEVKVLAEDDVNSAVTADLGFGDYVITTSNAPVKNGDMVRLADNP